METGRGKTEDYVCMDEWMDGWMDGWKQEEEKPKSKNGLMDGNRKRKKEGGC